MIKRLALSLSLVSLVLVAASGAAAQTGAALKATATNAPAVAVKPSIVLVHGAFADGSGWQYVIPILEKAGYNVIAVQNPLSGISEDIATTKRVIDAQKGSVVVVGHSYGGAVISGAATGNPNVKALVYIAAFAPDSNEPLGAFLEKYPSALLKALRPDAAGYLYIDRAQFRDVFAADVSATEASVMSAAQGPVNSTSLTAALPSAAAWRTIPSWYMVARQDRAINPELERFYAKRMGATTTEIDASHVPFISQPKVVAELILQAAAAGSR